MEALVKGKHYEIKHPVTGKTEVWTGERIEAYKVNYGAEVSFPPKRTKKTTKK